MKSVVINGFGEADVFKIVETDMPKIRPGHVIVKVEATSVNPLDFKLRKGIFPELLPQFPMILQGDVAGIVIEAADDVTKFKVGDAVYGCAGGLLGMNGALAEYMLADVDLLAHKPERLSFIEAAALPLVSLTAWEALVTKANLQKNQTILIHGGTGGVGHVALQLAKWLGAKVYATNSDDKKLAIAKQLGADDVINYKTMMPQEYIEKYTANNGFDVILDTVGGDNIYPSVQAAASYGQVVSILPSSQFDSSSAFIKNLTLHYVFQPLPLITGNDRAHYGDILKKMAGLVDRGVIKPLIDNHEFTFYNVGAAHHHLESGHAIGKVVIRGFF